MNLLPPVAVAPSGDQGFRTWEFERAMAMRFEVYCLECNFLSREDYPNGVETDEHDEHAAHFYAFDDEQELVGYVRLVSPGPESRFPFQRHCHLSADIDLPRPLEAAEISRLMVRRDYRRRQSDGLSGVTPQQNAAAFSGDRRHQAPEVLLNLYRQMYQHCLAKGIRFWYAAMEKSLSRSLAQLGFGFVAIGPSTDYYGPVAPYIADLRTLEVQVRQRNAELMAWLRGDKPRDRAERTDNPISATAAAAIARPASRIGRLLPELCAQP